MERGDGGFWFLFLRAECAEINVVNKKNDTFNFRVIR